MAAFRYALNRSMHSTEFPFQMRSVVFGLNLFHGLRITKLKGISPFLGLSSKLIQLKDLLYLSIIEGEMFIKIILTQYGKNAIMNYPSNLT